MDFTARIDGRRTPKDAENIGRKAGAASAEGFDDTWSKGYEDSLTKAGQDALRRWRKNGQNDGTIYGKEIGRTMKKFLAQARTDVAGLRLRPGFMDDFARGFDDAGLAARDMQTKLIELNREGEITGQVFDAARRDVDEWVETQRKAGIEANNHRDAIAGLNMDLANQKQLYADITRSVDRHTSALGRSTVATKKQGLAWGDIPHNGRQVILITAAIAAGAESIAVLGSAAGAGIIALGGAFSQFAVGGVATAAVFNRLNKDLEDLPAALRPVAREFQDFQGVFGELADTIAGAAFANMGGVFDSLRDSVSALNPAFAEVGDAVGNLFRDFANSVKPGSEALANIGELVENSADGFDQLARTAGTLGGALVRSFNRANPLVEDLLGWIDKLVVRFDDFTQSRNFDEWISRAQAVFGSLGELLDATGQALNDLVTPESVARTVGFLDNLTAFMPDLSRLLNTIGALDVFGLAAQLLAEFGEALRPLAAPMRELAEEVSRLASGSLTGIADGFATIAELLAPLVQGFANILSVIPTEAMETLGEALVFAAGGFVAFKAVVATGALITTLSTFTASLGGISGAATRAGGALRGLGKAGAAGIAITGLLALGAAGNAIRDNLTPSIEELTATLKTSGAGFDVLAAGASRLVGITPMLRGVGDDFAQATLGMSGLSAELEFMQGPLGGLANMFTGFAGVVNPSTQAARELSDSFASMAATSLPEASKQFQALVKQQGLTKGGAEELVVQMGSFREELVRQAGDMGIEINNQNLLALAMGQVGTAATGASTNMAAMSQTSVLTGEQIDVLAEKIRNFGNTELSAREAARQFEAGLDELTQSIITNGTTLDINTQQGRANQAAIDAAATAVLGHSAATLENTGSQAAANDVIATGRVRLMEQLAAFGMTTAEASAYVDELGLIPADVRTQMVLDGVQHAMNQIDNITRPRTVEIRAFLTGVQGALNQVSNIAAGIPGYASGTITSGPQHALIGEAGPEAVVPLNRPLSMVDPSVRWLSAIAQGKQKTQTMASGGLGGMGGGVTFEAGSIVVQAAVDPRQTALDVADMIADRIAS